MLQNGQKVNEQENSQAMIPENKENNRNNYRNTNKKGKNRRRSVPQTQIEKDFCNFQKTLDELNKEYQTRSKSKSPDSDENRKNRRSRPSSRRRKKRVRSTRSSRGQSNAISPKSPLSSRSPKSPSPQSPSRSPPSNQEMNENQHKRFAKSKSPRSGSNYTSRRSRTNASSSSRQRARTRSRSRPKKYDGNNINSYGSPLDASIFPHISEEDSKLMDEYALAMSQTSMQKQQYQQQQGQGIRTKIAPLNSGVNNVNSTTPELSLSPPISETSNNT